jgi:hypothetical protein
MSWQKKIEISVNLLSETAILMQGDDAKIMADALDIIKSYLCSDEFKDSSDDDKYKMSIKILTNTFELCESYWWEERSKLFPLPQQTMSFDEVKNKLIEQYLEDIKSGDDNITGLNINEWIIENGINIEEKITSSSTNE